MKNLNTMTAEEKKQHMANILNKMKSRYIVEDVTPKGYGPDKK